MKPLDDVERSGVSLQLVDLTKRYGSVTALSGASISMRPGEIHGFIGPNGAGKTTAMRIAIGVLTPDSGQVLWNGREISEDDRRAIGYMPEERGLYPKMKVTDQLAYLAELHGMDRSTAQDRAEHWIERLGLEGRGEDRIESLSLGNQQRVQLSASLVFDPQVLILDEPFSGLDPLGVDLMSEVLSQVSRQRGTPILFSSHQLELVERLCERVTIIRDGAVQASGSVSELSGGRALADAFRRSIAAEAQG